jgi:5-methylcytosine-specific restriction protein A
MTPFAPLRPCAAPGCPRLVPKGKCSLHRRQAEQQRGTPSQRGYDHAWQAVRARVLAEEAYCRHCGADGHPSDHVDHLVPRSRGGTNDRANLQRLCHACHSRKTQAEGAR